MPFLSRSNTIGLLRVDTQAWADAANKGLKPALAAHGLSVAAEEAVAT